MQTSRLTELVSDSIGGAINRAASLVFTAGAGMGVDSGLPDFRGPQGFWRAYPGLKKTGLRFEEIANPPHFKTDPSLAWGFYGHRLKLYRETRPHDGYRILLELGESKPDGYFVFTSNVDGHFEKAGFDSRRIVECHGSIHYLQCLEDCRGEIWPADDVEPVIDEAECRMVSPLPKCSHCGAFARPNILMFGDWGWNDARAAEQERRYAAWRKQAKNPVVIEVGAGTAIPSVRIFGERQGVPMIRINPDDVAVETEKLRVIPMGALETLREIEKELKASGPAAKRP
jgi:NAD-dependent SIR2 family protein deacetylase